MHYIRFLKPPRLLPGAGLTLAAKITVTTDLGESFLWEDVALIVEAVSGHDKVIGKGGEFLWKGLDGMRSLEVSVLLSKPRSKGEAIKMLVRPKEQKYASENFEALLDQKEGGIVTVRSTPISTSPSTTTVGMAERVFTTGNKSIHIWEETGESIARHIWDAGLILSSHLSSLSLLTSHATILPNLQALLSKPSLNILELGAGCGIVGITLATFFPTARITLTDLPEASEILTHNLSLLPPSAKTTHGVLDWAEPLPPLFAARAFDLVVLADCTYNPDVVPDLVATLVRVGGTVLVAMKVRHESEMIFFGLMREAGFVVVEQGRVGVEVVGGEAEAVEMFLFRLVGSIDG